MKTQMIKEKKICCCLTGSVIRFHRMHVNLRCRIDDSKIDVKKECTRMLFSLF